MLFLRLKRSDVLNSLRKRTWLKLVENTALDDGVLERIKQGSKLAFSLNFSYVLYSRVPVSGVLAPRNTQGSLIKGVLKSNVVYKLQVTERKVVSVVSTRI